MERNSVIVQACFGLFLNPVSTITTSRRLLCTAAAACYNYFIKAESSFLFGEPTGAMIAALAAAPHTLHCNHSLAVGCPPPIVLRNGTLADLDSILDIGLAAMPMDPQWNYRFPHRKAFPQDQRDATRKRYREFLENSHGRWSVTVAVMFKGNRVTPVAFAVWDIGNLSKETTVPQPQETPRYKSAKTARRDGNQTRMQAWNCVLHEAKSRHFEHRFGTQQFQLQILATHPDFQRFGAGSLLVRDGIMLAEAANRAISVFASPMGERLYASLGFKRIESVMVQVKDDPEFVSVEAMAYEPQHWHKNTSELVSLEDVCASGVSESPIWVSGAKRVRAMSQHVLAEVPKWKSAML
jgi:GNAT superfamily N-acetyltransferase